MSAEILECKLEKLRLTVKDFLEHAPTREVELVELFYSTRDMEGAPRLDQGGFSSGFLMSLPAS